MFPWVDWMDTLIIFDPLIFKRYGGIYQAAN